MQDVFIACVDGLKGFPEAIETVFPKIQVQLCIMHLVRNSLNYVGWKERKMVATDLKKIYTSATQEAAEQELETLAEKWNGKFASIALMRRRNWEQAAVCFSYLEETPVRDLNDQRDKIREYGIAKNY